jgi:hypothetical protein
VSVLSSVYLSALCSLLLMLIISAIQLTAHASLLSSSLLLMHLPPLKAFTCCSSRTAATALQFARAAVAPDAYIDILHNSQGLLRYVLFHPRAVTPLGSSPRTRIAASVHYACSHLCVCARVSTWVIKSIAHTKRVASRSIRVALQFKCHATREA